MKYLDKNSVLNEEELIALIQQGSHEAFTTLVAIYQKTVLNICYRFLLNKEDAEDISQEVFVEIFHSIKSFRGDSKLNTWIHRIAISKSLDEIKKKKRRNMFSSFGKALGIEYIVNLTISQDNPDKKLAENEDLLLLSKALGRLPQNQRIAITLSKIEGYSNAQIAELLDTTLTAVDSLIYRGKQNLKKKLMDQTPENKFLIV